MTECGLDAIRAKKIWRLTPAEIDRLTEQEQGWVRGHLYDMKQDGTLAMLLANDADTIYSVEYDRQRGWVLRPRCHCDTVLLDQLEYVLAARQQFAFIEAYFEYHGGDGE